MEKISAHVQIDFRPGAGGSISHVQPEIKTAQRGQTDGTELRRAHRDGKPSALAVVPRHRLLTAFNRVRALCARLSYPNFRPVGARLPSAITRPSLAPHFFRRVCRSGRAFSWQAARLEIPCCTWSTPYADSAPMLHRVSRPGRADFDRISRGPHVPRPQGVILGFRQTQTTVHPQPPFSGAFAHASAPRPQLGGPRGRSCAFRTRLLVR